MRLGLIVRLIAAALLFGITPALAQAPLTVMTFNIRYASEDDNDHAWSKRREVTAAMLERAAPDLIGTQELLKVQGDYLTNRLKRYAWFGTGRRGGDEDEHMGIFYRTDRLRLIRSGNFWLSETPEVPGTSAWGADLPRLATWGLFETIQGKRRFFAFNTHLPHRAQDEAAREKGAALVLTRIRALAGDLPVVLTGDFNTTPGTPTHRILSEHLQDVWTTAPRRTGPAETFHDFTGTATKRIDWIFTRGFVPRYARTVTDHQGATQTSDHFPVLAQLDWAKP